VTFSAPPNKSAVFGERPEGDGDDKEFEPCEEEDEHVPGALRRRRQRAQFRVDIGDGYISYNPTFHVLVTKV
jgi:hypothetical protein